MFKRIFSRSCIIRECHVWLSKNILSFIGWLTHQNNWCLLLLLFGFSDQIYGNSFIYKKNNNILSNICSEDLRLLDFYRTQNTRIATLIDRYSNKFILKQKIFFSHITFALEKLGFEIARSVNLCANQVRIIPKDCFFIGKERINVPATLHTFVPGIQLTNLPKHLHRYAVCLRLITNENPCKPEQTKIWGFPRKLISLMTLHKDFPKIVALDTFMANYDRTEGNLFYDEKIDRFFLIDFECGFSVNLAEGVYQSFLEMLQDENVIFLPKEIESLIAYKNMLKHLIKKYDPKLLNAKIDESIEQAKMNVLKERFINKRAVYNQMIVANYNSCIKVVYIVDKLLEKHS